MSLWYYKVAGIAGDGCTQEGDLACQKCVNLGWSLDPEQVRYVRSVCSLFQRQVGDQVGSSNM